MENKKKIQYIEFLKTKKYILNNICGGITRM